MAEPFTVPGTGLQRFVSAGESSEDALARLLRSRISAPQRIASALAAFQAQPTAGGLAGASRVFNPPVANIRDDPLLQGTKFIETVAGPGVAAAIRRKLDTPGVTLAAFTPQERQLLIQGIDYAGRELDRQYIRSKQRSALSGIGGKVALGLAGGLLGATGAIANITGGLSRLPGVGNLFGGAGSGGTNALAGNAVPGISTGVTTPAGGGAIVGSAQAAQLTGLAGGAPLGASPLAVAGGAAPASLFPRFPQLGKVQALPSGQIPGTNTIVGGEQPNKLLEFAKEKIKGFAEDKLKGAAEDALKRALFGGGEQQPGGLVAGQPGGAVPGGFSFSAPAGQQQLGVPGQPDLIGATVATGGSRDNFLNVGRNMLLAQRMRARYPWLIRQAAVA